MRFPSAEQNRYPALDGLRVFCFLPVILYHSLSADEGQRLPHALSIFVHGAGRLGVEMFFALSGFLITGILLRRPSLKVFYIRRALRIWPIYYIAVAAGIAVTAIIFLRPSLGRAVMYAPDPHSWTSGIAGSLLFVRNWIDVREPTVTNTLWSLCVEEQYYLVFPLLLLVFRTTLWPALLWTTAAIAARVFMAHNGQESWFIYKNTIAHGDCLVWGSLAAELKMRTRVDARGLVVPLVVAVASLPFIYSDSPTVTVSYQLSYIVPGIVTAALVYALSCVESCPRTLRKLGTLTYSAYVFHLYAVILVWHLSAPARLVTATALTLAIAWAMNRYIETPFLRLKERINYSTTQ